LVMKVTDAQYDPYAYHVKCANHPATPAVSTCNDCGKPLCWACGRGDVHWGNIKMCKTCYDSFKKGRKKHNILAVIGIVSLLVLMIAGPLIMEYQEDDYDDYSSTRVYRVEPYRMATHGNESVDIGLRVYVKHHGETESGSIKVEALLKVDGITIDSGERSIGSMKGDRTEVVDLQGFTIYQGSFDVDILLWEDDDVQYSYRYEIQLTGEGRTIIEEEYNVPPSDDVDGSEDDGSSIAGPGGWYCIMVFVIASILGAWFFTRIPRRKALQHPNRDNLYRQIRSDPGIQASALQQGTGMARGTMDHHLNQLEQHGMVRSYNDNGHKRYVTGEMKNVTGKDDNPRGAIYAFVEKHPGSSQKEIAQGIGQSIQATNYHVNRMKIEGEVRVEYDGRSSRVYPPAEKT